jgi:hypothetical protein
MEQSRKKQWLLGVLLSAIFLTFFFGWLTVNQRIEAPAESGWIFPILWFSLGISILCAVAFVSREKLIIISATALAFIPSIFFVHDAVFILSVCAGMGLSIVGLSHMRQDAELYVRIGIRRSMQHGLGWLVFSFSLIITSFYYMQIRHASGEDLLQKLSIDQASHVLLTKSLGLINPEFKKANRENVTVDEFLLNFQKDQSTGSVDTLPIPSDEELLRLSGMTPLDKRAPQTLAQIKKGLEENKLTLNMQDLALEQGRAKLSDIVGTPLSGKEPIADILSQVIDQRVRTYFKPDEASGSSSILPFVLSIILFVTLWSLGSVLGIAWRFLTTFLFMVLRRFGAVNVRKVMVEQEVIG